MLARRHRFHGYHSLDSVYRRGTTVRGPVSMVRFAHNPKRHEYRLAVVVSKKVHKSAVMRNRIRRRVYEIARTSWTAPGPFDVVITIFDESVATMPAADISRQISKQLACVR